MLLTYKTIGNLRQQQSYGLAVMTPRSHLWICPAKVRTEEVPVSITGMTTYLFAFFGTVNSSHSCPKNPLKSFCLAYLFASLFFFVEESIRYVPDRKAVQQNEVLVFALCCSLFSLFFCDFSTLNRIGTHSVRRLVRDLTPRSPRWSSVRCTGAVLTVFRTCGYTEYASSPVLVGIRKRKSWIMEYLGNEMSLCHCRFQGILIESFRLSRVVQSFTHSGKMTKRFKVIEESQIIKSSRIISTVRSTSDY